MRSNFPISQKRTELGIIPDPIIPISVLTKYGYQVYDFLVDTGADCSIMPKTVAEDLCLNLGALPKIHFKGIEGSSIVAYLTKVTMRITNMPIFLL